MKHKLIKDIPLLYLETFALIAETLDYSKEQYTISQLSKAQNIPLPTLLKTIEQLESHYNTVIIKRDKNQPVSLTENGRNIVIATKQCIEKIQVLSSLESIVGKQSIRPLKILASSLFQLRLLPTIISTTGLSKRPFQITTLHDIHRNLQQIRSGFADIAIDIQIQVAAESQIISTPVWNAELIAVWHREKCELKPQELTPEDLTSNPVAYSESSALTELLGYECVHIVCDTNEAALAMTDAGCIALVYLWPDLQKQLAQERNLEIRKIKIPEFFLPRINLTAAIYYSAHNSSEEVRRLAEAIELFFKHQQ
jgi:DNA-binding transcriptional LysR family regulator